MKSREEVIELVAKSIMQFHQYYHKLIPEHSNNWDEATEEERASAVRCVTYAWDSNSLSPEEAHKEWVEMKLADGFTSGEYNREAKTHPKICEWEELEECPRIADSAIFEMVQLAKALVK